ncbi:MAG: MFS transporter [Anaerolineae bacterium]
MDIHIPFRLPSLREFSRDARLLILVAGLTAISFFGVHSLLRSLYLLRLGFGTEYLGAYYAVGALTFMAMGVPSGMLGQRFGTRRVMLVAGWLVTLGMLIFPVTQLIAQRWPDSLLLPAWPFVSQLVLTVGWSMYNVNTVPALMAVTRDHNRSSAYALTSALRSLGTFLGTLAGGALPAVFARLFGLDPTLQSPTPYSYALITGALLGLLAIMPLGRIRTGQAPDADGDAIRQRGPFPFAIVASIILYVFLRHTAWTTCQAFCNPYMDEGLKLSTATIGALTGAGQAAAVAGSLLIPRFSRRWHHGWIVVLSTAILGVSLALLGLWSHWLAAGLGLLGVQVAASIWLPALQVFQMELVDEGWRGLSYGAVTMAMGSGFGSMSLVGGYYIEARGYRPLFGLGVILAGVASLVMAVITLRATQAVAPDPGRCAGELPEASS